VASVLLAILSLGTVLSGVAMLNWPLPSGTRNYVGEVCTCRKMKQSERIVRVTQFGQAPIVDGKIDATEWMNANFLRTTTEVGNFTIAAKQLFTQLKDLFLLIELRSVATQIQDVEIALQFSQTYLIQITPGGEETVTLESKGGPWLKYEGPEFAVQNSSLSTEGDKSIITVEMKIRLDSLFQRTLPNLAVATAQGEKMLWPAGANLDKPQTWATLVGLLQDDLKIQRVWIGDANGSLVTPSGEEDYFVWVSVANPGPGAVKSVFRVILDGTIVNETLSAIPNWDKLLNYSFRIGPSSRGQHNVTIVLNPDFSVFEENYQNNAATHLYYVGNYTLARLELNLLKSHDVKVNGTLLTTDSSGWLQFQVLPHTSAYAVSVEPLVNLTRGERAVFSGWLNGPSSPQIVARVPANESLYLRGVYSREDLLNVTSVIGSTSGGGWYEKGSSANYSVEPLVELGHDTRYVFCWWGGDVLDYRSNATAAMERPENVEAVWCKQYLVSLASQLGTPEGGGWYNEGSDATVRVEADYPLLRFDRWIDERGNQFVSPVLVARVDAPRTLNAVWELDLRQLFLLLAFAGIGLGPYLARLTTEPPFQEETRSRQMSRYVLVDDL